MDKNDITKVWAAVQQVRLAEDSKKKKFEKFDKKVSDDKDEDDDDDDDDDKSKKSDDDKSDDKDEKGKKKSFFKKVDESAASYLDEGYRENQERYIAKVKATATEIASIASNMVEGHKAACQASDRINSAYKEGKEPSLEDRKSTSRMVYDAKGMVRALEDVRDMLEGRLKGAEDADISVAEATDPHTRANSKSEKMDDLFTASDKKFLQAQGVTINGTDSGIDGAKAAEQTAAAIKASEPGKAAKRTGDK